MNKMQQFYSVLGKAISEQDTLASQLAKVTKLKLKDVLVVKSELVWIEWGESPAQVTN